MPHDIKGAKLKVGDTVKVLAKVTSVQVGEEYCNISLETVEPMFPGTHKASLTLNGRQIEKLD